MSASPAQPGDRGTSPQPDLPVLPSGWCWTTLETIASIEGGVTKDQKRPRTDTMREVPYLRVANVQRGFLDLTEVKAIMAEAEEIEALRLQKGDILFTEGGDRDKLGRGWVWNDEIDECIHQNHIFRARLRSPEIEPKFVSLHGNHFGQAWFTRTGKQTTNLASINKGVLRRFPVPMAPSNEQRRIVAKVEELLSELDAGVATLRRVQTNLNRHRSAVLKAAVEGRLTEAWRANRHPTETGAQLLDRILKERRQTWEEKQLAAFAAAKKDPPENWHTKYKEPACPDTATLPSLPESWCWVSVEQLLMDATCNGISVKGTPEPPGVPALRLSAMSDNGFIWGERRYIPISEDLAKALAVVEGDFFVCRGNGSLHLVGRGTLATRPPELVVFPDTMIRVRLFHDDILRRFVAFAWASRLVRQQIERKARTTAGIYKISQRDIERVVLPLPPMDEQREIVYAVEQMLAISRVSEAEVARGLARAARLRQSILKQAFEGKLVAQDPADEPASALLARVQQERSRTSATVPATDRKPGKLPREVFLRRASVVSYTVRRLSAGRSFGRTQLEKTVHLTQCHLGVDLGFVFERYAAGPFDKDIYKLEGVARKNDWFTTQKRPTFGVTYHPGGKIDQMCEYAAAYLGDRRAGLDRLLDHIAGMNTDEAELFATAYAAWNDLLLDGRPADDEAIIAEVHGWHEQKRRFAPEVVRARLDWMRQNGYIPAGHGQRTRPAPKETKLHSRRRKKGDASA